MGLFILLFLCILCCSQAIALQEVDCNDNEVFNAVDIALKEYNRGRKNGHLFALNVILEASRTVSKHFNSENNSQENIRVHHILYPLHVRTSDLWQKKKNNNQWGHLHGMASSSMWENKQCSPGKVASSQAPCLGCWTRISTKASELQPVVKHGIEYFSESFANFPKYFFQVVAGWNYKVQYSIKTTNCSKAELPLLTPECQAIPEGREGICTITAYVHFTNELVKSFDLNNICGGFFLTADEIVPAPVCVGCPVSISIHNPELQEPLAAALEKYNSESQNDFHYAIVQITKATSQVGTFLLHLYFNFVQTQCSVGVISLPVFSSHFGEGVAVRPGKVWDATVIPYQKPLALSASCCIMEHKEAAKENLWGKKACIKAVVFPQ
uniref:Cystatin domain-containing protein n=1 Tax=Varanus komodoensis TaxID=61221 RepID=A0A8D2L8E8_VARKO